MSEENREDRAVGPGELPGGAGGARPPRNRVTSEPLRKAELVLLCGLFLALCAALAWRGVGFLRDGAAAFPLVRLSLPFPAGSILGGLFLALAAGIAAATLALGIRFRR